MKELKIERTKARDRSVIYKLKNLRSILRATGDYSCILSKISGLYSEEWLGPSRFGSWESASAWKPILPISLNQHQNRNLSTLFPPLSRPQEKVNYLGKNTNVQYQLLINWRKVRSKPTAFMKSSFLKSILSRWPSIHSGSARPTKRRGE